MPPKRKGPSKATLRKILEQRKHEEEERKTWEEKEQKEEERARLLEEKLRKEAEDRKKLRRQHKKKKKEKQRHAAVAKTLEKKRARLLTLTSSVVPFPPLEPDPIPSKPSGEPPTVRAPIIVFLGHVDAGKTKLMDRFKESASTQEAGGITQGISGAFLPASTVEHHVKDLKVAIDIPGIWMIDTPGHEIFDHLRSRGSEICDVAILVIDLFRGVQLQTIECLRFLTSKRIPFIIALTKLDLLVQWKVRGAVPFSRALEKQKRDTKLDFQERVDNLKVTLMECGVNANLHTTKGLFHSGHVPIIPVSSIHGEGIPDLLAWLTLLCRRSNSLRESILWKERLQGTVLEVQKSPGCGVMVTVVLVNGALRVGNWIRLCGFQGQLQTKIRNLFVGEKAVDLVYGSAMVKICAPDLGEAMCGSPIEAVDSEKSEVDRFYQTVQTLFVHKEGGVGVFASTVGGLEALLKLLQTNDIPIGTSGLGKVHLKDVKRMNPDLVSSGTQVHTSCILAFDVTIDPKAQALAKEYSIPIFGGDVMYRLVDDFLDYQRQQRTKQKEGLRGSVVFPCKLQILPDHIYHTKDPFIFGVQVVEGVLMPGTPLAIPSKKLEIGFVKSIQKNNEEVEVAEMGDRVAIQIRCSKKYTFGRQFNESDLLLSRISRKSLDLLKEHFREEIRLYRHCRILPLLRELKAIYTL